MPCQDGCRSKADTDYPLVSKALCAVLTVLEKQEKLSEMLKAIDWEESGVTRYDVAEWWTNHKREDAARRKHEAADKRREKLAQEAYDKLTPAQREALGVRAPVN